MEEQEYTETDTNEVVYTEEQPEYTPEEVSEEPQAEQEHEDAQDRNWREVRKTMEEQRRIIEEQQKKLQQIEYERMQQQQMQQQNNLPEKEKDIDEDDILTYGQLKEIQRKEREAEERRLREQKDAQAPQLLRQKYDDFDLYVTQENIERLSKEDPELADTINALNGDKYKMGKLAYEVMKSRYGQRSYDMAQEKKVKQNQEKPLPANSVKRSNALSSASAFQNGLTPELKAQLWKEMEESIKHR